MTKVQEIMYSPLGNDTLQKLQFVSDKVSGANHYPLIKVLVFTREPL